MRNAGSKYLWKSVSTDYGATWSTAEATAIETPIVKTCVKKLSDGKYYMMTNDHDDTGNICERRVNMSIRMSSDAESWGTAYHIDSDSDNDKRIAYPDFIDRGGVIYAVTSRYQGAGCGTPNTLNGHIIGGGTTPHWIGKIGDVTKPAKVMGVDVANIAKVKGVA